VIGNVEKEVSFAALCNTRTAVQSPKITSIVFVSEGLLSIHPVRNWKNSAACCSV